MQIFRLEIKKIICRKPFWIIVCLLLATVFIDFFITCKYYYGQPLSTIPSAHYLTIINKYEGGSPVSLLFDSFLFFLVVSILASDTFYEEKVSGINSLTFTRISRNKYVFYKAIAIMVIVFFIVSVSILLSQFLAICAFPMQGHVSGRITYNGLMTPDENRVFSYFENYYPYWNSLFFIILRGLIGATTALLSFSLAFLNNAKRYTILLAPMVFYVIYSMVTTLIASKISNISVANIVETNMLKVNTYGSIWVIISFLLFQLIVSVLLIRRGLKNENAVL